MNRTKKIFYSALILAGLVGSSSATAGDNGRKHGSKHHAGKRMEVCRLKHDGTYRLFNLRLNTALKRLIRSEKYALPNENGTCEFEPEVDWGTCPCVEEGGPWRESFGLPDNDRNIARIVHQLIPPALWLPYDADGNVLGEITISGAAYATADPIFLLCGASNLDSVATDLYIEYDDNTEAGEAIGSCSRGLAAFGSDQ